MTLRPQTFLTGLLALLAATLLALVLAGAKPTSGGNELIVSLSPAYSPKFCC
jgi:hypothetical protein